MYEPREDSELMLDAIRGLDLRGERALDMGTGSGILAGELAGRFEDVVAVDIQQEAVDRVDAFGIKNVEAVKSDLFENVNGGAGAGKFDLIVFNPPYLPEPYEDDVELHCGDGGVIARFLEGAKEHLKPGGRVLLLLSSITPKIPLDGWKCRKVRSRKISFEELFVLELMT